MTFKEHADKLAEQLKAPPKPHPNNWPLKLTYKATNKEVVANARALQLNTVIEVLSLKIQDATLDAATLVSLTESFVELQRQYKKLQEEFFTGDGRSYRKNRGKKKGADLSKLLK